MRIITLLSDMGIKDYYVASVKGTIYSYFPEAKVVDISHHVQPFDIAQASFILKNVYKDFPKGSIHIIGVNPEKVVRENLFDSREEVKHLVVEFDGHYFIGADNGIFSLLMDEKPERIFEVDFELTDEELTFPVKTVFARAACMIAAGQDPGSFGVMANEIRERVVFRPVIEKDLIKGTVIYVDSYGNVITNITRQLFEKARNGRKYKIVFRSEDYEVTEIRKTYNEVPEGEMLALFASSGHLEIAINKGVEGSGGGASGLFGLKLNDTIRVEFY